MDTTYTLTIRYWRDKTYGNTYYSACAYGTDGSETVLPFRYGHGDLTAKVEMARALGVEWGDMDWEGRRTLFPHVEETRVTRRRDLHNGGKC